jgi:gamma-glutamylcyclotransferase
MKYFAYGSNMLEERLKAPNRVPGAVFLTKGCVRKYKLRFHKKSDDGSGKCNIVRTDFEKDVVYGVVFDVPDDQLEALERAEGVGHGYHQDNEIPIRFDGTEMCMLTYAADLRAINDTLIPYVWYHELVIAGAEQHGLPEDYIAGLQAVPYSEDPKPSRRTKLEAEEALKAYQSKMCS